MQTMTETPVLGWEDLLDTMDIRQGDHLTGLGPTGVGKTTFATRILEKWPYVVAVGTKPRDESLQYLMDTEGYKRIREWPPNPSDRKVVLWPNLRKLDSDQMLRNIIINALDDIYLRGAWAIYWDELADAIEELRIPNLVTKFYRKARALGISMVGFSQRPAYITRYPYSSATHLVLWNTNDLRDAKTLSDVSGRANPQEIRRILGTLEYHQFLYVDTRSGQMAISQVEGVN